jgi:hypothetical protein
MSFNKPYFDHYCYDEASGAYKDYQSTWQQESFLTHLVNEIQPLEKKVTSVLLLGTGTGEAIDFLRVHNLRVQGIEVSAYAYERMSDDNKKAVHLGDARQVLPEMLEKGLFFDMVYSGCLQYLKVSQLEEFLPFVKSCAYYFCHFGGFKELDYKNKDTFSVTLEPYKWWKELFLHHKFQPTHNPYIWKCF